MTTIPEPSIRKNSNRNASDPSHLPPTPPTLHPLPASLLLSQDPRLSRLLTHDRNDFFSTGCRELDSHVLLNAGLNGGGGGGGLGGFERGCVVGLSCEEEETIGLAIGLQVVARMLLMSSSSSSSSGSKAKAMIITTLSTTSLLPRLRLALVSEARVLQGNGNAHHQVDRGIIKSCLERVLVARVFDAEGLREVLRELEVEQQTVVRHSDGNEGRGEGGGEKRTESKDGLLPDLIIITNTSHLLNTLFTRNKTGSDRSVAHNSAVQLSDQIRGLSRRGPLVMMLNSTTSPTTTSSSSFNTNSISMFDDDNNNNKGPKQPDLSIMRSIFNPPPPPPPPPSLAPIEAAPGYMGGLVGGHTAGASSASYRGGGYGGRGGGYGRNHSTHLHSHQTQTQSAAAATAATASRRNKPSYGMVFSQMLDLHLLCTKMPRGRTRHGGAYGGGGYGGYGGYVWAVEVLLDEFGVYEGLDVVLDKVGREGGREEEEEEEEEEKKEGQSEQQEAGRRNEEGREGKRKEKGKGLTRRSREQRWGAVEIEEGSGRVVDAFR